MSAIIGSLRADLSMRSVAFNKGVDEAQRKLAGLQRDFRRVGRQIQGIGRGMLVGITAPLTAVAYKSTAASKAQEQAVAAVKAALASMGDQAGYTLAQLEKMASGLQDKSLYGDENILSRVTANLLTFGNVQGEVFARAQQSAIDLSARLGQDLQSSTVMLGKALNDPIKGLTALSRVGVSFTKQQEVQIKAMAKAGDVAGAQALMLAELEKQYSGQAEALAKLDSGRVTQAWNSVGDALEDVGKIIQPIIADVADSIKSMAEAFQAMSPTAQKFIVIGGAVVAVLGPLVLAAGIMVTAFAAAAPVMVALAVPMAALGAVAGVVVAAWEPLSAAVEFLLQNIYYLSPVIGALAIKLTGVLIPALTSAVTGFIGLAAATGVKLVGALRLATFGLKTFRTALISTGVGALVVGVGLLVGEFVKLVEKTGSVSGALNELWVRAKTGADGLVLSFQAMRARISAAFSNLGASVIKTVSGFLNAIIAAHVGAGAAMAAAISVAIDEIKTFFSELPDAARQAIAEMGEAILNGLLALPGKALQAAGQIKAAIIQGLRSGGSAGDVVAGDIDRALKASRGGISLIAPGGSDDGSDVKSYLDGLASGTGGAAGEALGVGVGEGILRGTKRALDIRSPSREGAKIGAHFSDGIDVGAQSSTLGSRMATAMGSAYKSAASKQYVQIGADAAQSLTDKASGYTEAARMLESAANDAFSAARKPIKAISEMADSQEDLGGSTEVTNKKIEHFSEVSNEAAAALKKVQNEANQTKAALSGMVDNLLKSIASGDVAGGFKKMFQDIQSTGVSSFTKLLKSQFSSGGAGFKGLFQGLGNRFKAGMSSLGSVFKGGGFGAIGSAVGSFMPVIGAVSSVIGLIKGFSSEEKIGGGLKLGIRGGDVTGGEFDKIKKKTFWGLFKKTYDVDKGFESAALKSFRERATTLRDTVKGAYKSLGVSANDAVLNGVSVAVQKINTKGLSQDQIDAKVQAVFAQYGDALSRAVGGVNLQGAIDLSQVNAVLDPLGKAFAGLTSPAVIASAAGASSALLKVAGGIEALGYKVSAFYDGFFSEEEKLQVMRRNVAKTFKELGLAVPKTDEAFKSLVLSQNLMTETGRNTYNALLDIAPIFDDVTDAIGEMSNAMTAAASAAKAARDAAEGERESILFRLLPERGQIESLRGKIGNAFASLGIVVPKTLAGLREVIANLNLSNEAGRSNFEIIKGLVPDFERVFGYLKQIRGEYSLDASKYATEWEAKLANEMSNAGRYSQDQITEQNVELSKQSVLLAEIRGFLQRQADTADASYSFAQVT